MNNIEMDKQSANTKMGNSTFNQTTTLTVENMGTASRNSSFKNINNQINNQSLLVFSEFNTNKFDSSNAKSSKNQPSSFITKSETNAFELENRLMIK